MNNINIFSLVNDKFKRALSRDGLSFLENKFEILRCERYFEEFISVHHELFPSIQREELQDYLIDYWLKWNPKNVEDLSINVESEPDFARYIIKYKNGNYPKKPQAGFLLIAAEQDFRCGFTNIPLMPIKEHIAQKIYDIPHRYAWYPSVDHLDSNKTGSERHSLANLCIVGREVNRMFGQYNKDTSRKMMRCLSEERSLDIETAQLIAKESLCPSGRGK